MQMKFWIKILMLIGTLFHVSKHALKMQDNYSLLMREHAFIACYTTVSSSPLIWLALGHFTVCITTLIFETITVVVLAASSVDMANDAFIMISYSTQPEAPYLQLNHSRADIQIQQHSLSCDIAYFTVCIKNTSFHTWPTRLNYWHLLVGNS